MLVRSWIDERLDILHIALEGEAEYGALQALHQVYLANLRDTIVDLSGITGCGVTLDQLRRLVAQRVESDKQVAVIATAPGWFGLSRMYQILCELRFEDSKSRMAVFGNSREAADWILKGRTRAASRSASAP